MSEHIDWEEVVRRVVEAADSDLAKELNPETSLEENPVESAAAFLAELVEVARSTPELPATDDPPAGTAMSTKNSKWAR